MSSISIMEMKYYGGKLTGGNRMTEFIVKVRCPACKYEEEEVVTADNPAEAKQSQKHCPRQQHIKMDVIEVTKVLNNDVKY
jgi:hypothetical protein